HYHLVSLYGVALTLVLSLLLIVLLIYGVTLGHKYNLATQIAYLYHYLLKWLVIEDNGKTCLYPFNISEHEYFLKRKSGILMRIFALTLDNASTNE
ncbi:hypothetical protein ACJX0J_012499, partial [Zea mays]